MLQDSNSPSEYVLSILKEVSLEGESWVPMPSAPRWYWISTQGRVYSLIKNKLIKLFIHPQSGYLQFNTAPFLREFGVKRHIRIHKEMAKAFLQKSPGAQCICHRNDDKADNRIENLYWGTYKSNQEDAERNGSENYAARKPCKRTCLKTGEVKYYRSVTDAAAEGFNRSNIKTVCKTYAIMQEQGKKVPGRKSEAGYKWEFINLEEFEAATT
jgi:hypothetical protein